MCDTGGPRCEYSSRWLLERRRLERSTEYRDGTHYQQKELLRKARNAFQESNPEDFKAHLPARQRWQTKAKPLPRRKMEAVAKTFSKPHILSPEEGAVLAAEMAEEHARLVENLSPDTRHALTTYSMASFEDINGYLRHGLKGIARDTNFPLEERAQQVEERIAGIKELLEQSELSRTPRVLYRHMLSPAGISTREYANKYFKVGERIRDDALLSTTEDPAYIRGHAHSREPSDYVVFQLLSRKGISLQPTDYESVGHLQSWEKERLLPPGTNFRVVGIRREEFSIHEDRRQMHKQFVRPKTGYWNKIPPKNFTVVQLVDEDLL